MWIKLFWQHPARLLALKVTIAMGFLVIPFVIFQAPMYGITLGLGALAGALSESNDHPKGRIKALALTIISFFISSVSVEILRPYPILFGAGLVGSTIVFIVLGGLGERYKGITFGALLIAIYTMLGTSVSPEWYWQPLLLPAGALFYGIISLSLLFIRPWRLLKEELSIGFEELSVYMEIKAQLFPSETHHQEKIRNQLATQNIKVVNSIARCKSVITSYSHELKDPNELGPFMHQFMLLQSLHERAASSHERYDLLSENPDNIDLIEGIGQLLMQLSHATHKLSKNLITDKTYKHPISLKWTVLALQTQLENQQENEQHHTLQLLIQNLTQSHYSLQNMNYNMQSGILPKVRKRKQSLAKRLKAQLKWEHPRLRYALRLSTCLVIGYALTHWLEVAKGDWILLTSLFVCQPSYSETRRRLFQRILGTLSGVVIAILAVQLLPTQAGQIVLLLSSAYIFFIWLRKNYAVAVVFITTFVMAAFNLQANQGMAVMAPRIVDTILGAILAIAVVRLMWPDWQYKRLPKLLAEALEKNNIYFETILQKHKNHNVSDEVYEKHRYNAHQADRDLTMAWQGMKLEPKNRQHFQKQAFALTYLNHALISYFSALGSHRDSEGYISEELDGIYQQVGQVLSDTIVAINEGTTCTNPQSMELFLKDLGKQLIRTDKGIYRQKLVLAYNIAEVVDQLLQELNKMYCKS
ncbi:TIGR01666 family membrane protein [Prolixibacteraceae bacterium JC049]|nr:TIGR01666 family membrane protein [Prolixibacteraceae bacterium JC049]